jgi:hypothetical protein
MRLSTFRFEPVPEVRYTLKRFLGHEEQSRLWISANQRVR